MPIKWLNYHIISLITDEPTFVRTINVIKVVKINGTKTIIHDIGVRPLLHKTFNNKVNTINAIDFVITTSILL